MISSSMILKIITARRLVLFFWLTIARFCIFAQSPGVPQVGGIMVPALVKVSGPDWNNKGLGSGFTVSYMTNNAFLIYDITAQGTSGEFLDPKGGFFKLMPGGGMGYCSESSGIGIFGGLSGGLYFANNGGNDDFYKSTFGDEDFKMFPLGWSIWTRVFYTDLDYVPIGLKLAYTKGRYGFNDFTSTINIYFFSINIGFANGPGLKGFYLFPGISFNSPNL